MFVISAENSLDFPSVERLFTVASSNIVFRLGSNHPEVFVSPTPKNKLEVINVKRDRKYEKSINVNTRLGDIYYYFAMVCVIYLYSASYRSQ